MSSLDRPFTADIHYATNTFGQLCLATGRNQIAAVVLVQHATFSIMCSVEGETTKLVPIACQLGTAPNFLYEQINNRGGYVKGNAVHSSDRDGNYKVHTLVSNQLAAADNW